MKSKSILRTCLIFVIVLLVPIVPFIAMGHWLEPWVEENLQSTWFNSNPGLASFVLIGVLGSDIVLPIPSSVVCTFAGHLFGPWWGALVSWIGLNLSCAIGYGLGYGLGLPIVKRFSSESSLTEMTRIVESSGVWALAICRAIPVVAEATVLVAGVYRFDARKFWLTVLVSNLGIAIAYSVLGDFSTEHGWLGLALAISLGLPLAFFIPWWFQWRSTSNG